MRDGKERMKNKEGREVKGKGEEGGWQNPKKNKEPEGRK
jgi:hypothetical protein